MVLFEPHSFLHFAVGSRAVTPGYLPRSVMLLLVLLLLSGKDWVRSVVVPLLISAANTVVAQPLE